MSNEISFKSEDVREIYNSLVSQRATFYVVVHKYLKEVFCVTVNVDHADNQCVLLNTLSNDYEVKQIRGGTWHE